MRRQARQDTREARIISLLAFLALAVSCLLPAAVAEEKQIKIVTTIFPIYDWTREVIGENAQAQLTLLLSRLHHSGRDRLLRAGHRIYLGRQAPVARRLSGRRNGYRRDGQAGDLS